MREAWHRVGDRPVRSLVVGRPRAGTPELVVVPGLGALGYLLPGVRACAEWTRVHLLDVPGFGHRATSRLPADLGTVAPLVRGWLSQVPTSPVVLVGHSTGAQVAVRASVHPAPVVERVVAAGITFAPGMRRIGALLKPVLATLVHERPGELPAVLPSYVRGARRMPQLLRTALEDRPEEVVQRLSSPLLVLRGERDRLCPPEWAAQLTAAAPDARDEVLPGAHNVPWTHPQELSAALRSWSA